MNTEAVSETQSHTGFQIIFHAVFIDGTHFLIIDQHHHPIGFFDGLGSIENFKTVGFGNGGTFGVFIKTDHHIHTAVPQILSVSVSLTAVTDHGNGKILKEFGIAVGIVVHFAHFIFPFC